MLFSLAPMVLVLWLGLTFLLGLALVPRLASTRIWSWRRWLLVSSLGDPVALVIQVPLAIVAGKSFDPAAGTVGVSVMLVLAWIVSRTIGLLVAAWFTAPRDEVVPSLGDLAKLAAGVTVVQCGIGAAIGALGKFGGSGSWLG